MSQVQSTRNSHTSEANPHLSLQRQLHGTDASHASKKQKGRGGPPKKRDTHFLCFPLVTDTSVPQLAESLRQFRQITTIPRTSQNSKPETKNDIDEAGAGHGLHLDEGPESAETRRQGGHELEPNTNHDHNIQTSVAGLCVLPEVAHRPTGTFHLTLGVMDLSQQEDMDRALDLLQELDYAEILRGLQRDRENMNPMFSRNTRRETGPTDGKAVDHETNGGPLASLERSVSPPTASEMPCDSSQTISGETLPSISLTGLSTFPSTRSSRVFYAKPSPTPTQNFPLLPFGQAIRRKFREAGFITETRPLVLHATLANMRYATQATGRKPGRAKLGRREEDEWKNGTVDARELIKCFDQYGGNVQEYVRGGLAVDEQGKEFVWASNIAIDRVALCKMGATKSDDEVLGMVYPPVGEKHIFV